MLILVRSNRFKMCRIDAEAVAAEMIYLETRRNWTNKLLVAEAMSEHHTVSAIGTSAKRKLAIACGAHSSPEKAAGRIGAGETHETRDGRLL